jgi:sulfur-oxidizing protein SoxY
MKNIMPLNRRSFLNQLGKTIGLTALATAFPGSAWAGWHTQAFATDKLQQAIDLRYPNIAIEDSDKVTFKAPAIAENGAVVPVSVKTDLANVKSISLFVEKNPTPLSASFNLSPLSIPEISVRIRMGQTSKVIAMVESGGKLHRAQQEVKVTIGGCGG